MKHTDLDYVLLANYDAMELFRKSERELLESASYDFMVYSFNDRNAMLKDLENYEDYVLINETTYQLLYANLCKKLRDKFYKQ